DSQWQAVGVQSPLAPDRKREITVDVAISALRVFGGVCLLRNLWRRRCRASALRPLGSEVARNLVVSLRFSGQPTGRAFYCGLPVGSLRAGVLSPVPWANEKNACAPELSFYLRGMWSKSVRLAMVRSCLTVIPARPQASLRACGIVLCVIFAPQGKM